MDKIKNKNAPDQLTFPKVMKDKKSKSMITPVPLETLVSGFLKNLDSVEGIESAYTLVKQDEIDSKEMAPELKEFIKNANSYVVQKMNEKEQSLFNQWSEEKKKPKKERTMTTAPKSVKRKDTPFTINDNMKDLKLIRNEDAKNFFIEFLSNSGLKYIYGNGRWDIEIGPKIKLKVSLGNGTSNESGKQEATGNEDILKNDLIQYLIYGENGEFTFERESVIHLAKFLGMVPNENLSEEEAGEIVKPLGSMNQDRINVKEGAIREDGIINFTSDNGNIGKIVVDVAYTKGEGAKQYLSVKSFGKEGTSGANFTHVRMDALKIYNEKTFYSAIQVIDDILINKEKLDMPNLDIETLAKMNPSKIVKLHEQIGVEYESDYSVLLDVKGRPKDEHKKTQNDLKKLDQMEKTAYDTLMKLVEDSLLKNKTQELKTIQDYIKSFIVFGKDIREQAMNLFTHSFFKNFGINPVLYLQVFRDYGKEAPISGPGSKSKRDWIQLSKFDKDVNEGLDDLNQSEQFEDIQELTHNYNDMVIKKFIQDAIGWGYVLIAIVGNRIFFKEITEDFYRTDSNFEIDNIEINYPSATSKAINMRIYSSHYRLDLMFRSTNGSIYPGDMTVFYVMNNLQEYMSH